MLTFIIRRIIAGFFIVLGASFIAFILISYAGNPLDSATEISNPAQRQLRIDFVTNALDLDQPRVVRFFSWLKGVGGCFVGDCDLGTYITPSMGGRAVTEDLGGYMLVSLKLVSAATVLAIVIGVSIGIVTALRQYSGFDYAVTFMTFVFFSLPVFWIGIMLKDLVSIKFNNFVSSDAGPTFTIGWIVGIAAFFGLATFSVVAGNWIRRIGISLAVALAFGLLTWYVSASHWLLDPQLGIVVVGLLAILIALGMTTLTSGLGNKRNLYSALATAVVGIALYYPLQMFFHDDMNFLRLVVLFVIAIAVGIGVGYLVGGDDRGLNARTAALTAVAVSIVIFLDRVMTAWSTYSAQLNGRPLATTGDRSPRVEGDFWIGATDTFTHLLLPSITLMLISLAGHSRYARASMLEVLNQDYVRTARAKGLSERTVVMRHAFRNALIPLTTIVAFDIGGLLGGAVVTETVFGWKSLGRMFTDSLSARDPAPIMGVFLVLAIVAVVINMMADIAYGFLDPRIRVTSK